MCVSMINSWRDAINKFINKQIERLKKPVVYLNFSSLYNVCIVHINQVWPLVSSLADSRLLINQSELWAKPGNWSPWKRTLCRVLSSQMAFSLRLYSAHIYMYKYIFIYTCRDHSEKGASYSSQRDGYIYNI